MTHIPIHRPTGNKLKDIISEATEFIFLATELICDEVDDPALRARAFKLLKLRIEKMGALDVARYTPEIGGDGEVVPHSLTCRN